MDYQKGLSCQLLTAYNLRLVSAIKVLHLILPNINIFWSQWSPKMAGEEPTQKLILVSSTSYEFYKAEKISSENNNEL